MSKSGNCICILIAVMILLGLQCRDGGNPIEPPFKDPRSLRWSADTILAEYSFATTLSTLWGSSARDVYLTGRTSNGAVLYHFDGTKWSEISMPTSLRGFFSINMIRGTGPNDVWLVGKESYYNFSPPPNYFDSTLVLHYNGSNWQQFLTENREGLSENVCVVDANNVWVSGRKALWNFQGGVWTRYTIPLPTSSQGFSLIHGIAADKDGNLFVNFYYRPIDGGPAEQDYFLSIKQGVWTLIDSAGNQSGSVGVKWGYDRIWYDPFAGLYSLGNGLFRWNVSFWEQVLSQDYSLVRMTTTGNGGLIVVGDFGAVLHFNGTDWYQFPQFKNGNIIYTDVWTDGKEVFITGYEFNGTRSVVLHGK